MTRLLIRWVIVAFSLLVAVWVVPGITVESRGAWIALAVTAAVLGFVNAIIRPILAFLSCGCIIATMGLFMFVINAFTLWLSSQIAVNVFNVGYRVNGFWAALWGSIVVSVVSFLLSLFVADED